MPKGNPIKPDIRRAAKELLTTEILSELRDIHQLIKEIDARHRVMFSKLHNVQVTQDELIRSLLKVFAVSCELFEEPMKLTDLEKVIRDFFIDKYKENKKG